MKILSRESLEGLPQYRDRHGTMYMVKDVRKVLIEEFNTGRQVHHRSKYMSAQIEEATAVVEEATKLFNKAFDHLMQTETKVSEAANGVSGRVKNSANDMHEGLQRIEKLANFDKLERHVAVLERAAAAMKVLAELEQNGSLKRIHDTFKG